MKRRYVWMLALAAGPALAGSALAEDRRAGRFDGTWSVRLTTMSGTCDPSYAATIAIREGRVETIGGSAGEVSGGVAGDGRVALGIRKSLARADASGRLQGRSGTGVWKVDMLGCTGRWTAARQTRQARAD